MKTRYSKLIKSIDQLTHEISKFNLNKLNVQSSDSPPELSQLVEAINNIDSLLFSRRNINDIDSLLFSRRDIKKLETDNLPSSLNKLEIKLSTASAENENISFFGYFDETASMAGHFFDFIKVDDIHYAAILNNTAGMGFPAALISTQVSSLFSNFFRNRKFTDEKGSRSYWPNIEELVYSMNDLLEEKGVPGRFSALKILLINSVTGEMIICHAGDNLLSIFDNTEKKLTFKKLPESPACGVFDSGMVKMSNGFTQVTDHLGRGDSLLMFTNYLEESQRLLRNENFEPFKDDAGSEKDTPVTVSLLDGFEEFGWERIKDIINSAMNKDKYTLQKYQNPLKSEALIFDFTFCEGTAEEQVMALVSMEKIFRLYPDPSAGEIDTVEVDKAVVSFLRKHFQLFEQYFSHPLPGKDEDTHIIYSHLKEDTLGAPIVILVIKKK